MTSKRQLLSSGMTFTSHRKWRWCRGAESRTDEAGETNTFIALRPWSRSKGSSLAALERQKSQTLVYCRPWSDPTIISPSANHLVFCEPPDPIQLVCSRVPVICSLHTCSMSIALFPWKMFPQQVKSRTSLLQYFIS
jgi:hypothetical protein